MACCFESRTPGVRAAAPDSSRRMHPQIFSLVDSSYCNRLCKFRLFLVAHLLVSCKYLSWLVYNSQLNADAMFTVPPVPRFCNWSCQYITFGTSSVPGRPLKVAELVVMALLFKFRRNYITLIYL